MKKNEGIRVDSFIGFLGIAGIVDDRMIDLNS